jgi:hypothetical protein
MKSQLRLLAIIGLMILLVMFTIGRVNTVVYINADSGISPVPSAFKITAPLYYMNENFMLEMESRTMTIYSNKLVDAIIRELKKVPANPDLKPVVDEGVRVLSAEIINQKLYLNLSRELQNSSYWQVGYHEVVLYSIVNSLLQFDTIERVHIKIEGRDVAMYLNTTELYAEFSFNDQLVYKVPQSPREIVETFLNYVMIDRMDLAYAMTSNYKTMPMVETDFERLMQAYRQTKMSYQISHTFVNEVEEGLSVVVNYEFFDRVRNVVYDGGSEEWLVLTGEDNQYLVMWPRP